jgi:hypothetical protein
MTSTHSIVSPGPTAGYTPARGGYTLSTKQAAQLLRDHDIPATEAHLHKIRSAPEAAGPPFRRFGGRYYYNPETLLAWAANERLSPVVRSISQLEASEAA